MIERAIAIPILTVGCSRLSDRVWICHSTASEKVSKPEDVQRDDNAAYAGAEQ